MVSSFAVRQVSQPQYMKIDRDSPALNDAKDLTSKGFSQDQEKEGWPAKEPERAACRARATKRASTTSWMPTSAYCTPFVVVMPR